MKNLSIKKLLDHINNDPVKWLYKENCNLYVQNLNFVLETKEKCIWIWNAITRNDAINWLIAYMNFHKDYTIENILKDLCFNA